MKNETIIRAWRDRDAFLTLTDEERAQLPANPAGIVELRDEELRGVTGAGTHYSFCEPTASWCDDCGGGGDIIAFR
ncbi:MAG: mersacidin/lichenicidin family type 2 lantibiotic [Acidobacteriota bacterium]